MTTRVLVTGAGGQVGVDFVDTLLGLVPPGADPTWQPDGRAIAPDEFDVVGVTHHDLDIADDAAVQRAVHMARPDVIVNLAAYTAVDRAESDRDACFAINDAGTASLSRAASDVGAHFVTVSTDYVFDGLKGAAYEVDDPTNPQSVYGASKVAGERRCRAEDTIVRTSWVMGVRGKNIAHVVATRAQAGETLRFVSDQRGTVTAAADLARALVTFVRERPGGIWHVANREDATWFEVADFVAQNASGRHGAVVPITTAELTPAPAAQRPPRSDLSLRRWESAGYVATPPWRSALERLLAAR